MTKEKRDREAERGRGHRGAAPGPEIDDAAAALADVRLATFLRGLVIGAFVGGAIAGSRVWRRIRERRGTH